MIEDREYAAAELRRITRNVVHAWAGSYSSVLHSLSGGLDSSIIAACLRDAPTTTTFLNVSTAGAGDESAYARAAAQHAGFGLVEHRQNGADVNLQDLLDAPAYPEPINSLGWLEHVKRDARLAASRGASAIFTGMGGDEIFGRTGATWAVQDFVRRHGIRPTMFERIVDAARQEQQSVWQVVARCLWGARWRPQSEGGSFETSNLSSSARADLGEHPALRDTASHLPSGKRRHVYLMTPVPCTPLDPVTVPVVERLMPLRSQPIMELCLRIPTYILIEDGWDRALVRRAFKSELPGEILSRRTKGEVSEYAVELLNSNLPFIRNLLLEGRLVGDKWLDQAEFSSSLSMTWSRDRAIVSRLLNLIDIEIWLRTCFVSSTSHSIQSVA